MSWRPWPSWPGRGSGPGRAEPDVVGDDGPFVRRGHAHRAARGPERQPAPRVELPGLEPERRGAVEDLVGDQVNAQPLAAEGRAERGQDQRQARRRVGRDQPVGEPVQPGELPAGGGDRLPAGDQRNHVVGVGIGRAHLAHDPALPQYDDAAGQAEHLLDVVAGQQDRGALLPQPHDQLFDLCCFLRAERGGRLVQGQQPGLAAHGPRHRHQLPLPAGQRADVTRRVTERNAQRGQQFSGGRVEPGLRHQHPGALPAEHDVGGDIQVVAQGQVLPDHRDPLLDRRGLVGRHAPTREEHLAAGRDHFAGDAADQSGLARAVLAGQGDEFTGPHAQVDVVAGRGAGRS